MRMDKDILLFVEALSNERGVSEQVIFSAIESALATATQKAARENIIAEVKINPATGEYKTWRLWEVIDNDVETVPVIQEDGTRAEVPFDPERHIRLRDARAKEPNITIGDVIRQPTDSVDFGRISAQTARQVIAQKVREAERLQVYESFIEKVGMLVPGTVKRVDRNGIVVDIGGHADGVIPREELIPRENLRPGDRVRAVVKKVITEGRGLQVILSRTCKEMLLELFKTEIPEIGEGRIEIVSAARDPGSRSKVVVRSLDPRVAAYGACIGLRGSRVQAIQNDLAGERIDVIEWHEDLSKLVVNTMAPAEVQAVVIDEESHSMDIGVAEANLAQAIGRNGQNVRMASKVTGWELNVMSMQALEEKQEREFALCQRELMEALGVDEALAGALVQEGVVTVEAIVDMSPEDLLAMEGFNDELVDELKNRAQDALLAYELSDDRPEDDLLSLKGMSRTLANRLAKHGVKTRDELAELATDELLAIEDIGEARAGRLIMNARAHWFGVEQ